MASNRFILNKLFLAIPELQIDKALLSILRTQGLVSEADMDIAARLRAKAPHYAELAASMRGRTLIQRVLLMAPEIMSVQTIDLLRNWNLIPVELGNALRVGLRAAKVLTPSSVANKTILQRWAALGGAVWSGTTVNLLRDLDNLRISYLKRTLPDLPENQEAMRALLDISVQRGQVLRSIVSTGKIAAEVLALAKKTGTIWGIVTVVAEGLLSDRLLRNAVRAGAISQDRYELIRALEKLGLNVWKKIAKGIEYDSMTARALLLSEGILSPEMIDALYQAKLISKTVRNILYPSATAIRSITRGKLESFSPDRRYRIIPGESPIKTYARVAGRVDKEMLKLLAEAAADARKQAERLASTKGFGNLSKAARQRIIEKVLYEQMHILWEGIGHLTIFGENEAGRAALDAMDFLQERLWAGTGKAGADFRRTILSSAKNGIDAYISRQENLLPLSKMIYRNEALSKDLVTRTINKGLLRGLSARDLARELSGLINPGVRGGVSYNALRLSRTEINNAFHLSQIRYTREMPWVEGYKWNLSGSHPKTDICNTYSQQNHDGIGRGVFKKSNVPGKPHPQCLCYITTVVADNSKFERQLLNGSYNPYLNAVERAGTYPEVNTWSSTYRNQAKEVAIQASSGILVTASKKLAIAGIASLLI